MSSAAAAATEGEESNQRCLPPGGRSQQALCWASLLTQNNVKTSVREQVPSDHRVWGRNRTEASWHLQRTRWEARKNAQVTMRGLLCPPPIYALRLPRCLIHFIRPGAADTVQRQQWIEDFV